MAMLYESLSRACARTGQFAIVATTEDEPRAVRAAAQTLLQRGVDGLVMSTARTGDDFPAELTARGVPFVISTGYATASLPDGYSSSPVLQKPFHQSELAEALALLFEGHSLKAS